VSPDDVKALRKELGCTAKELASVLEVEPETVAAWERGELFPTKHHVSVMGDLLAQGPAAVPRKRRKGARPTPMQALADPELWRLVRKLLAHAELRAAADALAASYSDPADDPASSAG
jgi:transcriptional regulator with XRE-family HTH domain